MTLKKPKIAQYLTLGFTGAITAVAVATAGATQANATPDTQSAPEQTSISTTVNADVSMNNQTQNGIHVRPVDDDGYRASPERKRALYEGAQPWIDRGYLCKAWRQSPGPVVFRCVPPGNNFGWALVNGNFITIDPAVPKW